MKGSKPAMQDPAKKGGPSFRVTWRIAVPPGLVEELKKHGGLKKPQPEPEPAPQPQPVRPVAEDEEKDSQGESWSWWKEQFRENLKTCRPDLLAEMEKTGTLEEYLEYRESRAIEMARQFKKDGLADDQIMELIIDDLFLREKEDPEEDEQDL